MTLEQIKKKLKRACETLSGLINVIEPAMSRGELQDAERIEKELRSVINDLDIIEIPKTTENRVDVNVQELLRVCKRI